MEKRRVSFHTLGCKLNFSESSTIARSFEEGGFVRVGSDDEADICVINSCSVTAVSDQKSRQALPTRNAATSSANFTAAIPTPSSPSRDVTRN